MSEEVLEQRIAEINAEGETLTPVRSDEGKRTYSVEEIQEILDISRSTAYQLIRRGLFKSVKAGKQIRISKKSFDLWLDAG